MEDQFYQLMEGFQSEVEQYLDKELPACDDVPPRTIEEMEFFMDKVAELRKKRA